MERAQAIATIRNHRAELLDFGASSLAIFGSVARDTAGPASDVDLLVEFTAPVGLITFVRLQQHLESMLKCRVDLVTPEALRPLMRDQILAETTRAIWRSRCTYRETVLSMAAPATPLQRLTTLTPTATRHSSLVTPTFLPKA